MADNVDNIKLESATHVEAKPSNKDDARYDLGVLTPDDADFLTSFSEEASISTGALPPSEVSSSVEALGRGGWFGRRYTSIPIQTCSSTRKKLMLRPHLKGKLTHKIAFRIQTAFPPCL